MMSAHVDLSVIIPAYNTIPDLKLCLDSVVSQDLGEYRYEIVAVDDGSTDGSGELLDEYAARYPAMHVIHQENSGWPGRPRNVGIDASQGRYLFFVDADDEVAADALRRQVAFADRHGSDIVVPMLQPTRGAKPSSALWRETKVDADRALIFKTLSPQKLFRRALLDQYDLRFPEGIVPLEDGLLLAKAYLLARRVSVLTDHEYYYKRARTEGGNISIARKPPKPFIRSVTEIIDTVQRLAGDSALEDRIVVDIYRRKALKYLRPTRFPHYDTTMQQDWVDAISGLAATRVRRDLDARLPLDARIQSAAVRTGDVAVVRRSAEALKSNAVPAHITKRRVLAHLPAPAEATTVDVTRDLEITASLASLRRAPGAFELGAEVRTRWVDVRGAGMELVLKHRSAATRDIVVPLQRTRDGPDNTDARSPAIWSAALPMAALAEAPPGRWDAYVRLAARRSAPGTKIEARVRRPAATAPALEMDPVALESRHIDPYFTMYDNLSFETRSTREDGRPPVSGSTEPATRPARSSGRAPIRLPAAVQARVLRLAGRVLGRLGMTMLTPGGGIVVISRRSDVAVTAADAVHSADATSHDLFDRHTALYRRLVGEHVSQIISGYDVNCVLDVGANKGQFARRLRRSGYRGHIVSFEPVPDVFGELESAAAGDRKWAVYPYALGREDGSIEMKVVSGTMSSALDPSEYGEQRYKRFRNIRPVDVPLRRLDGLLDEITPDGLDDPRWYLKLDTQGYDLEVFAGLGSRVTEVVAMQSEMALLSVYEDSPRLPVALETYEAAGFEVSGMFPVTREKGTGRVLEFDCVLVRADALAGRRA